MKNKHCLRFAGVVTFGLVAICGLGIGLAQNADAITCSTYSADGLSCATTTTLRVTIESYITASFEHGGATVADDTITVTLTPGSTDLNSAAYTTATVSTNAAKGYTLSVADKDSDTSLSSGTHTISTNASIATAGQFGWAIQVSNCGSASGKTCPQGWQAMVASGSSLSLASTTGPISSDTTTVQYGIRVSEAQAAGTYADTIVYTATVNG